ncbi:class I SAM-dependent methyltransferase [Rhodococcus sp. AG1013]|uniref:class I SAM-dependent methyltransferase n=1 Tax=unclassified Rhodococcus (in: high G+C Gram-positive bacteria) TaxID=192944 RepID=UPI000E0AD08E|nr:class I SAM-dependent methyltransferase [Rhodococcus sp. AG1013]RDI35828.1 methyltransferase family protein [Rhodococcus sp. AG1013]
MADTRWQRERSASDSRQYIERFAQLEAEGTDLHGEARAVDAMLPRGSRVLDAGCGTGRLGAELARRGHRVTAVDLDPILVAEARKHSELTVHEADLATLDLPGERFDAVVAAGNVLIFVARGTERRVVQRLADHLVPGGILVTGFATDYEYTVDEFDADLAAAGLVREHRFATWDLRPWRDGAGWAVTVARKPGD